MDNTKKNLNVPNLRFSNKEVKWKKYKVSDLLKCVSTNSLTWNELSYDEKSSLKNIHYGLIHNGFSSTCITCDNQLIPYVIENNLPKQYIRVEKGDLILADASEDRKDVGRAIEIIDTNNEITISGLHTIHAKDISNLLETGYKGYYFNSIAMKKQIHRIANGSKIYSISPSNFKELFMTIPNKKEQAKIVSLLSLIEDRIETQNKIIEDLKIQKKAIIDMLLNEIDLNITIPLSSVLNEYVDKTERTGMYPVLSSTANGIFLQSEYFNKEASSDDTTGYKIVPKGYCTYRSMSDTGKFIFNQQNVVEKGLVSPAYPVFYSKSYDIAFIILYLNHSKKIQKQIIELKTGGTRFALSFKTLCTLQIPNVSFSKQSEIRQIIDSIDNKLQNEINIHQLYSQQKQYLLSNLFI